MYAESRELQRNSRKYDNLFSMSAVGATGFFETKITGVSNLILHGRTYHQMLNGNDDSGPTRRLLVVEKNEVDRYLGSSIKPECNTLKWWSKNAAFFPVLSAIARDFFGVCASSVESERQFSKGGKLITPIRSNLSVSSVQMCMCLKSWYSMKDLFKIDQSTD